MINCSEKELLLYAVTDRHWLGEETLYDQVKKALDGGATFVQLREKNSSLRRRRYRSFVRNMEFHLSSMTRSA